MKDNKVTQVYRFGDQVAIHVEGHGETIYLRAGHAAIVACALRYTVEDIRKQPRFSQSTLSPIHFDSDGDSHA